MPTCKGCSSITGNVRGCPMHDPIASTSFKLAWEPCPCADPVSGLPPCTPERPCPYAWGRMLDEASAPYDRGTTVASVSPYTTEWEAAWDDLGAEAPPVGASGCLPDHTLDPAAWEPSEVNRAEGRNGRG